MIPDSKRGRRLWPLAVVWLALALLPMEAIAAQPRSRMHGQASWYGEAERGKPMANGHRFDPDKMTAASWFYPLGTQVRVTADASASPGKQRTILVTITDRGPATGLVRNGRVIDLGYSAFEKLADPDLGLIAVTVEPIDGSKANGRQPPARAPKPR